MRSLSPQLTRFTLIAIVLTLGFHLTLNSLLASGTYAWIWVAAVGFAVAIFINGLLNGRADAQWTTRSDLGFRYHLATFLVAAPLQLLFAWFTRPTISVTSKIWESVGVAAWALALGLHSLHRLNSIKGYQRGEVFD